MIAVRDGVFHPHMRQRIPADITHVSGHQEDAREWRDQFLAAGQAGLKSHAPDARDDDHRRLQAKIGELLMETELLYAKVDQLEAGSPLARRRSTR